MTELSFRSLIASAVCALALGVIPSETRAATIVTLSATGAADVTLAGASDAFFADVSIGNFRIASLDVSGFSGPKSSGQTVDAVVESLVPDGSAPETLTITVLSALLSVADDLTGTGTPIDTPISVASRGTVRGSTNLDLFGSRSILSATDGFGTTVSELVAGAAAPNPSPGSTILISGTTFGPVTLFEERPFEIESEFTIIASGPGFSAFRSAATVVPLSATLPLALGAILALGGVTATRRRKD